MGASPSEDELPPGVHVGRYVILGPARPGRLGRVYAAWHPALDRKVALELVPPAAGGDRARHEAMARLSHPNVVAVHDVGAWAGGRFVARELVDGQTLDTWLHEQRRSWVEVVAVFVQAGRGLAAAHRAGLVHGDFGPSHVVVRGDGRAVVKDCGLAPEDVDARGDLISFCAALNEALAGRPVPAPVRRVVAAPASLEALLARLEAAPRRARLGRLAAAAVVLAVGTAALAWRQAHQATQAQPCPGAEARLAGVWDPSRKQALRTAILATGAPGAERAADAVDRAFDAYAARWTAGWTDACEARSDTRLRCLDERARAWRALGDALLRPDAESVDRAAFAGAELPSPEGCADPRHLDREPAAGGLALRARRDGVRDRIATAAAAVRLGHEEAATPEIAAGLQEARALRSPSLEAELLALDGDRRFAAEPMAALAAYHAAAEAGERAGRADLVARARLRLAYLLGWRLGRTDDGLLWAAYAGILIDRLADAELAAELARAVGDIHERARQDEQALRSHQQALAVLQAHAAPGDPRVARALDTVAGDLAHLNRIDEAREYFRRAVALCAQIYGPDHPRTLAVEGRLFRELRDAGRPHEALQGIDRVIARTERVLGPDALQLAEAYQTRGRALLDLGRAQDAVVALRRAVSIGEQRLGRDDAQLVDTLSDLSSSLTAAGLVDEGLATATRALQLGERAFGVDDGRRAEPEIALGRAQAELGRCREALAAFDRAQLLLRALGRDRQAGQVDVEAVACRIRLGRAAEALSAAEAYLGQARSLNPKGNLAAPLVAVARARIAVGQAEEALPLAEEALAILTAVGVIGPPRGQARFALAQALWQARPSERARARELASAALEDDAHLVRSKEEIARWRRSH